MTKTYNGYLVNQLDWAYRILDKCRYRPKAPSDGFGSIDEEYDLTLNANLEREIEQFVEDFERQDEALTLVVGCPSGQDQGTYALLVESLRMLSGMCPRDRTIAVLKQAIKRLEAT